MNLRRLWLICCFTIIGLIYCSPLSYADAAYLSIDYSPAVAVGVSAKPSGFGIRLSFEYDIVDFFGIYASAGYRYFNYTTYSSSTNLNLGMIPLLVGLNVSLGSEMFRYYLQFCVGYFIPVGDFVQAGFGIVPETGIKIHLGNNNSVWLLLFVAGNVTFNWRSKEYLPGTYATIGILSFVSFGFGLNIPL